MRFKGIETPKDGINVDYIDEMKLNSSDNSDSLEERYEALAKQLDERSKARTKQLDEHAKKSIERTMALLSKDFHNSDETCNDMQERTSGKSR